jgi:hypothetical protein
MDHFPNAAALWSQQTLAVDAIVTTGQMPFHFYSDASPVDCPSGGEYNYEPDEMVQAYLLRDTSGHYWKIPSLFWLIIKEQLLPQILKQQTIFGKSFFPQAVVINTLQPGEIDWISNLYTSARDEQAFHP